MKRRSLEVENLVEHEQPFVGPTALEIVEELAHLRLPALKLASTDLTNVPLVSAAADSGIPLIMSTGAADLEEVRFAVDLVSRRGGRGLR